MKLKMVEPGYQGCFTGNFGGVEFVDGVSVNAVSDVQARLFASLIRMECLEDGTDPGANAQYQAALEYSAPNVVYQTAADAAALNGDVVTEPVLVPLLSYTREQLEAVADKDGIAGLRKIADPLNVKSTSVAKLINAILSMQSPSTAPQFIEGSDPVIIKADAEVVVEAVAETEVVSETEPVAEVQAEVEVTKEG